MKKILLVTDVRFWRKSMGSQNRISRLIEDLMELDVCLSVYFVGEFYEADTDLVGKLKFQIFTAQDVCDKYIKVRFFERCIKGAWLRALLVWFKVVDKLLLGRKNNTPVIEQHENLKQRSVFENLILNINPEIVVVEYVRLNYLTKNLKNKIKWKGGLAIDTHDVSFSRYESFKEGGAFDGLRISKRKELSILKRYDYVIAIQYNDQAVFQSLGLLNAICIPYSLDAHCLESPPDTPLRIGFFGSSMSSNVSGIRWFIREILPKLQDVYLNIYGSVCSSLSDAVQIENVRLNGFVKDLGGAYAENHIIINPVKEGGGLKIKSVEALAYGKPLLATEQGLLGMPDSECYRQCSSDLEWLKEIDSLKSNKVRCELAKKAVLYINTHFSREVVRKKIRKFVNDTPSQY